MDSSRFLRGFSSPPVAAGIDLRPQQHPHPIKCAVGPRPAAAVETAVDPPPRGSYMFPLPLRRLWPGGGGGGAEEELGDADAEEGMPRRRRGSSWVMNILRVRSLWARVPAAAGEEEDGVVEGFSSVCGGSEGCAAEEEPAAFDGESFSRLLRRVSLLEAELYKRMLLLSHSAYSIPKIKPSNLLKFHGLRFITSSLEKNAKLPDADDKEQTPAQGKEPKDTLVDDKRWENSEEISPSDAYQVAASAASYLQSLTRGIPPFGSAGKGSGPIEEDRERVSSPDLASFVATTNSMTAVVAGKEEMKQAVAKDLNSALSSPCEWFICDDDSSSTRHFVIQGSESLASWQANLLFEPIQFEELDVLVHRGIYEAAKGIYQQMLPEIRAHLRSRGNSSSLRFTGHSLGGSLALLVNLMLLIRGDAPASSLLPVITFGAPSIMCGGDYLLRKLGLPRSHVQCITMHRDIVPRAFSCNYPDHVARILTAVNENFRNHPCLKIQKHLYTPMGKLLILQPDEKLSPHHHLLPKGAGLYLLDQQSAGDEGLALLRAAQSAFLNSPHPLEILSDRAAYGSEGTVLRDHDVGSYLRSVRGVIRHELKLARKAKGGDRQKLKWSPLVGLQGTVVHRSSFAMLKRFGSMVASQHVRMFLVLLVSAKMLLLLLLGALPNFS